MAKEIKQAEVQPSAPWDKPATPTVATESPQIATTNATAAETATDSTSTIAKVENALKNEIKNVEDFVTVTVPRAFKLTLDHATVKQYNAGIQPMLKAHADHWWSKANGVVEYTETSNAAELPQCITLIQLVKDKFHALDALNPKEKEDRIKSLFEQLADAIHSVN